MHRFACKTHDCFLVREGAPIEERLADEAELPVLAIQAGALTVAGEPREIIAISDYLGAQTLQQLEARAYAMADALVEALEGTPAWAYVYSAYHEIATNWLQVLMWSEALQKAPCIALLNEPLYQAFVSRDAEGDEVGGPVVPRSMPARAFGAVRFVLGRGRRSLRLVKKLPGVMQALKSCATRDIVVITCNDSGTGINLRPMKAIESEIEKLSCSVLVLSETELLLADAHQRRRKNIILVDGDEPVFSVRTPSPALDNLKELPTGDPQSRAALEGMLAYYWPKYVTRFKRVERVMELVHRVKKIRSILSISETMPISITAGLWGRREDIPWKGHFTATIGNCPDHFFFPADEQLAYGGQLRDHILATGKAADRVHSVGCPNFDAHLGRDRQLDREAVKNDFPAIGDKKLVVVATEAFPDPETELEPILRAVCALGGVRVILKLHPEDRLEAMQQLVGHIGVADRLEIVQRYPLGQLLGAADLLVCVLSTIIIEAAVIGTPTLSCDFSGKTKVLDFVEQGLCMGCREPEKVAEQVRGLLFDPVIADQAQKLMMTGISRFNGPNDGQSAKRIAHHVVHGSRGKTV